MKAAGRLGAAGFAFTALLAVLVVFLLAAARPGATSADEHWLWSYGSGMGTPENLTEVAQAPPEPNSPQQPTGIDWQRYTPTPTANWLWGVDVLPSGEAWAVGHSGTILRYSAGTWLAESSPTTSYLYGIDMLSSTEGWAVGASGAIVHYVGGAWQNVSSPTSNTLRSVSMLSSSEGWAVGSSGTIQHYQGGTWQAVPGTFNWVDFYSVAMVSASEGWAVGQDPAGSGSAAVVHYTAAGGWATPTALFAGRLWSVSMVSATDGWAVGDSGVIVHYSTVRAGRL